MQDKLKSSGKLHVVCYDVNGNVKTEQHINNTLTQWMDEHVASRIVGTSEAVIGYIAVGSGVLTTPATGSTLKNLVSIIALSGAGPLQSNGSNVVFSGYWDAGVGTGSITEAGVYRTSGTAMSGLVTYSSAINVQKGVSDTLKIDWTVTY